MSFDYLSELTARKNNVSVLGLDPAVTSIPPCLLKDVAAIDKTALADAAFEFCSGLILACADIVAAVKPQSAYFERFGSAGILTLEKIIDFAHEAGLYVVLDAKRGDIGATSEAYAEAAIGKSGIGADAVTVNPYLGSDGVLPFVKLARKNDRALFALVKTSNPSSGELQDALTADGEPLYMRVARMVNEWGGAADGGVYSRVGAVVGATYPAELAALRQAMPRAYLLVPGYGAQGGKASDLAAAFDEKGGGACVNASRSLMCAYKKAGDESGENYKKHARAEALRMRDELNAVRFK